MSFLQSYWMDFARRCPIVYKQLLRMMAGILNTRQNMKPSLIYSYYSTSHLVALVLLRSLATG